MTGFVHQEKERLVDGSGNELFLKGVGIGNWLLPEGYMWQFNRGKNKMRADRPRRIEALIEELAGPEYAREFWKRFRNDYITESDIKAIASCGFNSVRIALNYRILMEDKREFNLKENGFRLLDKCFDWCEKHDVYAIIDLHGAPGGQTGANIDDSVDDLPRLFIDRYHYDNAIILWIEIARRYKERGIIAAYDLLNEPLAPEHSKYKNELIAFYQDVIKAIRQVDTNHMLSIEGMNWSTNTEIFDRVYDNNVIIHFHRYWCEASKEVYGNFIELRDRFQTPLWLGESGENSKKWYNDMFNIAEELQISWNFWPWKRMKNNNPTLSEINEPEGWNDILTYIEDSRHLGERYYQKILDAYLENIKFENTTFNYDLLAECVKPRTDPASDIRTDA